MASLRYNSLNLIWYIRLIYLRPFLQNVYSKPLEVKFQGAYCFGKELNTI